MANINKLNGVIGEIGVRNAVSVKGCLVRAARVSAGGVIIDERIYDPPASNTIVDSGVQQMCNNTGFGTASGSSAGTQQAVWVGHTGNNTASLLHFAAYGTSDTPTLPSMTALVNQVSGYTSEIYSFKSEELGELCGTSCDQLTGVVKLRITHQHAPAAESVNVKEVGIFGRRTGSSDYVMWARVVLPDTITLNAGEYLQTTYELHITVPHIQPTPFDEVEVDGVGDAQGWRGISGVQRVVGRFPNTDLLLTTSTNNLNVSIVPFPVIATRGVTQPRANWYSGFLEPSVATHSAEIGSTGLCSGFGNRTAFPNINTEMASADFLCRWGSCGGTPTATNPAGSTGERSAVAHGYVGDNSFRVTYQLGWDWPNGLSQLSMNFLNLRGMGYLFDRPLTKLYNQRLTLHQTVKWLVNQ